MRQITLETNCPKDRGRLQIISINILLQDRKIPKVTWYSNPSFHAPVLGFCLPSSATSKSRKASAPHAQNATVKSPRTSTQTAINEPVCNLHPEPPGKSGAQIQRTAAFL